jgi:hypothetical protein
MSIVYRIDKEIGITYVVWDGPIGAEEMTAQVRRLIADPDWPPEKRLHLVDLQTANLDDTITETVLREAAELYSSDRERIGTLRQAIVAGEAFMKSRLFESFMPAGPTVIVFNNVQTACAWLGISGEETDWALRQLRDEARGITD